MSPMNELRKLLNDTRMTLNQCRGNQINIATLEKYCFKGKFILES